MERRTAQTMVQVLAIVFMALGAFGVVGGIIALFVFHSWVGDFFFSQMPAWAGKWIIALALFEIATSALQLVAGIGMLRWTPWSRILGIVVGCVALISFPLGTAVGVFTIWLLAIDETSKSLFGVTPVSNAPPPPA